MLKQNYGVLILAFVAGFPLFLGSCDLFLTAYTIQVRLGHQNPDDPNPATFTLSDLPPRTLNYNDWDPDAMSYFEHTAKLKSPSDFTVIVEAQNHTIHKIRIPIQEGYRYSIYYMDIPAENDIFWVEAAP